jgi:hypothetical protein
LLATSHFIRKGRILPVCREKIIADTIINSA